MYASCSVKLDGEALKGIGALQHLQQLILIDNPLRTAAYLNPLPPNLTALTLQGGGAFSQSLADRRVDVSAALSKPAQHRSTTDSSGTSMPGGNLLALNLCDMDLHEPSLVSSLTSLTALDTSGLHCQKPSDLLAVLPCLRQLRYLDLSIKDGTHSYMLSSTRDKPVFDTDDFARLVYGCPDLEWLSVAAMPGQHNPWGAQQEPLPCSLLALQGATRLTSLTLWANERLQDTHLTELVTLTGLHFLSMRKPGCSITDAGVQALTQLTGLTRLVIDASDARRVSKQVANGYRRCVRSRAAVLRRPQRWVVLVGLDGLDCCCGA